MYIFCHYVFHPAVAIPHSSLREAPDPISDLFSAKIETAEGSLGLCCAAQNAPPLWLSNTQERPTTRTDTERGE